MIVRGGIRMTTSAVGYPQVRAWVKAMLGRTHATVVHTIAWAVLCLLVAQLDTPSTPAAARRARRAARGGRAGPGLAGVRRWWRAPPLDQVVVSPQLIHAALAL